MNGEIELLEEKIKRLEATNYILRHENELIMGQIAILSNEKKELLKNIKKPIIKRIKNKVKSILKK